ncbi:hypothetical protein [Streptomyces sp. TP-A0356]|uniref:hypothetical protein n=1 Tax=Streptomyces sp. TP-A0356 TaxID=1359208 RepID=UPI0006E2B9B2|nr:hypothetical protein [Streptomyces sp. TP-A0356]
MTGLRGVATPGTHSRRHGGNAGAVSGRTQAPAIATRAPVSAASAPHSRVATATAARLLTVHAVSTRATLWSSVRLRRRVANGQDSGATSRRA